MAATKLIIRPSRANRNGDCTIMVLYTHWSEVTYFSTKEKINPKYWDRDKCQVKRSYRGHLDLNDTLEALRAKIEKIRLNLIRDDIEPTIENVREAFEALKSKRPTKQDFFDYEQEYLEHKAKNLKDGSMRHQRSFFNQMRDFQKYYGKKITFAKITEDFYEVYTGYFFDIKESAPNTVGDHVKMLKTFLGWAHKLKYHSNDCYKDFYKPKTTGEVIALTFEELEKFYSHDFSQAAGLERVRDVFILGCSTGMRYSDLLKVTTKNIQSGCINIRMEKTEGLLSIPLNEYSETILKKYGYKVPKMSVQNFNINVKEAGKRAGLNLPREITKYKGRKSYKVQLPLHELLRSHICRKTFVSINLDQMSPRDVMALSGHSDWASFERYVAASPVRLKQEMRKIWTIKKK